MQLVEQIFILGVILITPLLLAEYYNTFYVNGYRRYKRNQAFKRIQKEVLDGQMTLGVNDRDKRHGD
jgi:hypothetical protein